MALRLSQSSQGQCVPSLASPRRRTCTQTWAAALGHSSAPDHLSASSVYSNAQRFSRLEPTLPNNIVLCMVSPTTRKPYRSSRRRWRKEQERRKLEQKQHEERVRQQRLEMQPAPTKENKELAQFWISQGIFKGDVKILVNYALEDPAYADLSLLEQRLEALRLVLAGARVEQMIFRKRELLHLDFRTMAERLMEYRYCCKEGVDVLGALEKQPDLLLSSAKHRLRTSASKLQSLIPKSTATTTSYKTCLDWLKAHPEYLTRFDQYSTWHAVPVYLQNLLPVPSTLPVDEAHHHMNDVY
eukprot:scaffold1085_cov407-Prasinococcus_capsulatus_cf.AAC.28